MYDFGETEYAAEDRDVRQLRHHFGSFLTSTPPHTHRVVCFLVPMRIVFFNLVLALRWYYFYYGITRSRLQAILASCPATCGSPGWAEFQIKAPVGLPAPTADNQQWRDHYGYNCTEWGADVRGYVGVGFFSSSFPPVFSLFEECRWEALGKALGGGGCRPVGADPVGGVLDVALRVG